MSQVAVLMTDINALNTKIEEYQREIKALQNENTSLKVRLEQSEIVARNFKERVFEQTQFFRRELAGKVLLHVLETETHPFPQGYAHSALTKVDALLAALVKEEKP